MKCHSVRIAEKSTIKGVIIVTKPVMLHHLWMRFWDKQKWSRGAHFLDKQWGSMVHVFETTNEGQGRSFSHLCFLWSSRLSPATRALVKPLWCNVCPFLAIIDSVALALYWVVLRPSFTYSHLQWYFFKKINNLFFTLLFWPIDRSVYSWVLTDRVWT